MLRDPRQKRFFKAKDISDLFQLGDEYAVAPETAAIFAGINTEVPLPPAGDDHDFRSSTRSSSRAARAPAGTLAAVAVGRSSKVAASLSKAGGVEPGRPLNEDLPPLPEATGLQEAQFFT